MYLKIHFFTDMHFKIHRKYMINTSRLVQHMSNGDNKFKI